MGGSAAVLRVRVRYTEAPRTGTDAGTRHGEAARRLSLGSLKTARRYPTMRVFGVLLIVVLLIVAIVFALWRRREPPAPRRNDSTAEEPSAPVALPAPAAEDDDEPTGPQPDPAAAAAAQRVHTALHALAFSATEITGRIPGDHARLANEALAAVETALDEPRYMPRRPNVIPELLRAVNDEDASRRQFSAIISRDPTLTADLLKIANTAFYRVSDQPVESLDRAVAVLGTQGIRSLVSSAALQPVFKVPAGQFTRFPGLAWDHAFLSGVAAESLAALAENEDPFAAQLLALLMGLGVIVAFRLTYDHYSREPGLVPDPEVFATMIDRQAAPIARRIAASWDLSERMITALNDQSSAPVVGPALLSRLGRSLWLGRTLGALALLVREGTLSAADARDVALAAGVSERLFDRLWLRLSQQQDG